MSSIDGDLASNSCRIIWLYANWDYCMHSKQYSITQSILPEVAKDAISGNAVKEINYDARIKSQIIELFGWLSAYSVFW